MAEQAAKRLFSQLTPEKHVSDDPVLNESSVKAFLREVLADFKLDTVHSQLTDIKDSLSFAQTTAEEAKHVALSNQNEIATLKDTVKSLQTQLKYEHEARLKLEAHSRRSNLRFYGIPEKAGESDIDCEMSLKEVIQNKLGISEPVMFERCHRLGPRHNSNRAIIVKFSFYKDRDKVWKARKNLSGTRIYIKEDFPPEIDQRVNKMMPIFLSAKKSNAFTSVKLVVDRLYINGQQYTVETIHQLPAELQPEALATRSSNNVTLFYRKESHLSNHHPCKIVDKGVSYNCVEQYLMVHKATLFEDENAVKEIMATDDPMVQKRVRVKKFNLDMWRKVSLDVMRRGLTMKYEQNPELKNKLLQTGNAQLAEAAPRDGYWGIGMAMHHPDALDRSKWGENHLGKLLMEVRQCLK